MTDEERIAHNPNLRASLDFLDDTPNKLAYFISGFSGAEFRLKNSADEFSALENICHLRDLERQGYSARINRILNETDPQLGDFDGARVAAESNYNDEEPGLAFEAFQTARKANVEELRSLSEEQLGREGVLEGVGRVTLRRLAEMMREHDEGHLEDLRVLRQRLSRSTGE